MKFTQTDIKRLQKNGLKITGNISAKKRVKVKRQDCKQVQWMEVELKKFAFKNCITFKKEYKFSGQRKFRSDFAIIDIFDTLKILIEYHGTNSAKNGHTSLTGFAKDCEKSNLAVIEGWKPLSYNVINYKNIIKDLKQLIK